MHDIANCNDIERLNEFFTKTIKYAASVAIPMCEREKQKRLPKPIVELIKKREALRKKYANGKGTEEKKEINRITKQIKEEIKKVRSDQWMRFLDKCSKTKSSKPIWNKINQLRTGKAGCQIPTLKYSGKKNRV
jgi:hypothetical protein